MASHQNHFVIALLYSKMSNVSLEKKGAIYFPFQIYESPDYESRLRKKSKQQRFRVIFPPVDNTVPLPSLPSCIITSRKISCESPLEIAPAFFLV